MPGMLPVNSAPFGVDVTLSGCTPWPSMRISPRGCIDGRRGATRSKTATDCIATRITAVRLPASHGPRIRYDLPMRIHHLPGPLPACCWRYRPWVPCAAAPKAAVDAARLRAADSEPGQWLMDGRNYSAQRYSPLNFDQRRQRQPARACVVRRARHPARCGSHAAVRRWRALQHQRLEHHHAPTTRRPAAGCGPTIRTFRARWGRYACCEPVARGPRLLERQGHHRDARRPADRARMRRTASRVWTCADLRARTGPIPSPAHRACSTAWWWWAMAARTLACAASSAPGMPTPASSCGSSTWCPAIPRRVPTAPPPTA